ncbi:hypothetical protein [Ralstonia sp. ASV6]|uniref:hypothetical protein n=1 Tax=Ralstonia sp. ASV6 TaxID=2795124 RepID=UPI0018EC1364|nr:hypothetical protein [Ralstonia sp. ASV6]
MRLPASVTTQPPEPADTPQLAATYVDPAEVSDVPQAQLARKPWWTRASRAIVSGAFTNVAAAFIAVTGAIYVGMVHAPWVRGLAGHTSTAVQASDAMSAAMAATPASAATMQAGQPDPVEAARDRMEQRVYSQVSPAAAHTVAATESANDVDSDGPVASTPRRHHRGTRHATYRRAVSAWNAHWYKGA